MPGGVLASAKELKPVLSNRAAARDVDRILPLAELELVKQSGFCAARIAAEQGGPDASFIELADAVAELSCGDPNVAQAIQPHFYFVEFLRLEGTPDQQSAFSREIMGGALLANAFAERSQGVVGEIGTRLTSRRGHLVLTGRKYYSTGSLFAEYLYVNALDDDGVTSLVVIPRKCPGVEIADDWDGMGQRTTASGTTVLDDVRVERENVIPLPELRTKRVFVGAAAQLVHAAIDVGIARAALLDAIDYAPKARPVPESGVRRATDDPHIIHAVGEMAVRVQCADAMLARAGAAVDIAARAQLGRTKAGADLEQALGHASVAVAAAKAVAETASLEVSQMMYRVGGAGMTSRRHNYDRHWRNARTHTTHDPVAYKYRVIGDFHLNARMPPLSTKF